MKGPCCHQRCSSTDSSLRIQLGSYRTQCRQPVLRTRDGRLRHIFLVSFSKSRHRVSAQSSSVFLQYVCTSLDPVINEKGFFCLLLFELGIKNTFNRLVGLTSSTWNSYSIGIAFQSLTAVAGLVQLAKSSNDYLPLYRLMNRHVMFSPRTRLFSNLIARQLDYIIFSNKQV